MRWLALSLAARFEGLIAACTRSRSPRTGASERAGRCQGRVELGGRGRGTMAELGDKLATGRSKRLQRLLHGRPEAEKIAPRDGEDAAGLARYDCRWAPFASALRELLDACSLRLACAPRWTTLAHS